MYTEGTPLGEYVPPVDYGERLRELYAVDPALEAIYRPQLATVAERVASSFLTEEQRQAVAVYAGILDWRLFGAPGDPLPVGLLKYENSATGNITLEPDPTIPFLDKNIGDPLADSLERHGIESIGQALYADVETRESEIRATIVDMLRDSAEYRLLASFEQPPIAVTDQPLSPYWRNTREAQINADIRYQHGYDANQAIPYGSVAGRALQQRLSMLDDETMLKPERAMPTQSGIERAKAYLRPLIEKDFVPTLAPDESIMNITGNLEEANLYARLKIENEEQEQEINRYVMTVFDSSRALVGALYRGPAELRFVQQRFMLAAFCGVFDKDMTSITEVIEAAVTKTATSLIDDVKNIHPEVVRRNYRFSRWPEDIDVLRKTPSGAVLGVKEPPRYHNNNSALYNVFAGVTGLVGKKEYREALKQKAGNVLLYGPRDYRIPRLLIRSGSRANNLDTTVRGDLVVQLHDYGFSSDPYVPGYMLTSHNGAGAFGFEVDQRGDPYLPCNELIDPKRAEDFVRTLAWLGLDALGQELTAASGITVSDFVRAVARSTAYHFPEDVADPENADYRLTSRSMRFNQIHDFEDVVYDGKLHVQCGGSGDFLETALNKLFPEGNARTVDGLVLPANRRAINSAAHRQVVFELHGRQYILDATGSGGSIGAMALGGSGFGLPSLYNPFASKPERKVPVAPPLEPVEPRPSMQQENTAESIDDKSGPVSGGVDQLLASFVEHTRVSFKQPNAELLTKHLVGLPSQDPARRTFELIRQYRVGRLTLDQLNAQSRYVREMPERPASIRHQLGINHYPPAFLQYLSSTVAQLQNIGNDEAAAKTNK